MYSPAVQNSLTNYMATGDANWRTIRGNTLTVMLCPLDSGGHQIPYLGTAGPGWARGNYACNAGGIHQPNRPPGIINNGLTNSSNPAASTDVGWISSNMGQSPSYVSFASFGGPVPNGTRLGGVMCINWGATFVGIPDGTSNTVLLSEVRTGGHLSAGDPRGLWAMGMPGASVICGNAKIGRASCRERV